MVWLLVQSIVVVVVAADIAVDMVVVVVGKVVAGGLDTFVVVVDKSLVVEVVGMFGVVVVGKRGALHSFLALDSLRLRVGNSCFMTKEVQSS